MERLYLFFAAVYFAQGMVGIAYEPINYLLKDGLGLSADSHAAFVACMTFPFLVKPLLGALSDAVPLGGRRRVPYLLLSSAATALCWLALALTRSYRYAPVLVLLTAVNVGIAFADVLCDAVMVEQGKRLHKTGPYQAAQICTLYATLLATGLGGGYLAEHVPYQAVFGLTAVFPLLILASAFLVPELPAPPGQARRTASGLNRLASGRRFWAASLVIFLFNFNPFLGTAQFYYQTDGLGFSKVLVGTLTSVSGLGGVAGAALFWRLYNGRLRLGGREWLLDTQGLVRVSVLAAAPLTLLYLGYRGAWSAAALTAFFGVVGVMMRLSLMDLAARACPAEGEATAFAAFMSVFALANWSSNTLGGRLYGEWAAAGHGPHAAMAWLVLIAAACTLGCWPALRWLDADAPAPAPPAAAAPAHG